MNLIQQPQDQGICGSCYIFSSRNVLNSLFMRDFVYYRELGITDLDGIGTGGDSVSPQYLLNNTADSNNYCAGGNFISVMRHVVSTRLKTIELSSNFPYTAFSTQVLDSYFVKTLEPKLRPSQHVLPVYWFDFDLNQCPLSVFHISAADFRTGWNAQ